MTRYLVYPAWARLFSHLSSCTPAWCVCPPSWNPEGTRYPSASFLKKKNIRKITSFFELIENLTFAVSEPIESVILRVGYPGLVCYYLAHLLRRHMRPGGQRFRQYRAMKFIWDYHFQHGLKNNHINNFLMANFITYIIFNVIFHILLTAILEILKYMHSWRQGG